MDSCLFPLFSNQLYVYDGALAPMSKFACKLSWYIVYFPFKRRYIYKNMHMSKKL